MRLFTFSFLFLLLFVSGCSVLRPERSAQYAVYRVQYGDTVSRIGERYGLSIVDIVAANDLDNPDELEPGQKLYLPFQVASAPPVGAVKPAGWGKRSGKQITLGKAKYEIGRLHWPTHPGARLSSRFGWRSRSFHEGIDLAARPGTPVYAAHSGKVVYSGRGMRGYGNIIVVKGPRLLTVYAHNERNRVRRGVRINRGEHIADVGSTGHSTGPHLHFETRVRDSSNRYVAVDPLVFFPLLG